MKKGVDYLSEFSKVQGQLLCTKTSDENKITFDLY